MCSAICRNKIQPTEADPWLGGKKWSDTRTCWVTGSSCMAFCAFPLDGLQKETQGMNLRKNLFFFSFVAVSMITMLVFYIGQLFFSCVSLGSYWPSNVRKICFFLWFFFSFRCPAIACRKCHPIISISNTLSESKIKLKLPVIIHSIKITIN